MYGERRLCWGLVGGLVLCLTVGSGLIPLAVASGVAVAAAVGVLVGGPAAGRRSAAVDGAWAGAIAAGTSWIGVGGAEVAIGLSGRLIDASHASTAIGPVLAAKAMVALAEPLPVVFWSWFAGGAAIGALAAVVVNRGGTATRTLPASFAPVIVLLGSVMGFALVNAGVRMFLADPMRVLPSGSADPMIRTQLGSAVVAVALGAIWTGWSAGVRVRHHSYAIRTTGALLAALGLVGLALLPLMVADPKTLVFAGCMASLAVGAAVAGYRRSDGTEPPPTLADGVSEALHAGLLGVTLAFGALGFTTAFGIGALVLPQIAVLDREHAVPGIDWFVAELRSSHFTFGAAAFGVLVAVLALFVFPSIVAQRWFAGSARSR